MKSVQMLHGVLLPSISVQAFTLTGRKTLSFPFVLTRSVADRTSRTSAASVADLDDYSEAGGNHDDKNVPFLLNEGIFAVHKPFEWTSSDVVSYIRGILERDARSRGARSPATTNVGGSSSASRRRTRKVTIKVGHGGTLDPLATGVLVIGVGSGTKELEKYLKGSKAYIAEGELGYETTTLDMEGNVTRKALFDHVTAESIVSIIPEFTGPILQVPPIYSAIHKNGKRLYQQARRGASEEDLQIEPRPVDVNRLDLVDASMPRFSIRVECGGGLYIRSLIRDMGRRLDSAATTYSLVRTKHGPFLQEHCLSKDDWNADNIYNAIENAKTILDKA